MLFTCLLLGSHSAIFPMQPRKGSDHNGVGSLLPISNQENDHIDMPMDQSDRGNSSVEVC